ncbi:MAG TPA: AAA family ATPase [Verrucomicrobiales bacterium]|jgi:MoxR-like ATPase|nr:AAA family ATPase [Verrucomicrobiales bacterium]
MDYPNPPAWQPPAMPPSAEAPPVETAGPPATPGTDEFATAAALLRAMHQQLSTVFLGQHAVVNQVLVAFIAGGHVLLEGKPGLGKTHLVLALARCFGGVFKRIQFTPDLMPGDVTGHTLYDMGRQEFKLRKGPVFANLLLADEINRAPAKTQAALLEVMQECQVTIDGQTLPLAPPFMTLATQNPIEQEGTYALPEAQLDRFLMKVIVDYPGPQEEERIVNAVASGTGSGSLDPAYVQQLCGSDEILALQRTAVAVQCRPDVTAYAVRIVRATREMQGLTLGAGTRGAISLVKTAKAFALLAGRIFVTPDDVKQAALPVLRHRVTLAPELSISGQKVDDVLTSLLRTVEAPR